MGIVRSPDVEGKYRVFGEVWGGLNCRSLHYGGKCAAFVRDGTVGDAAESLKVRERLI